MNSSYKNFNHKHLDSIIHNRLRLAILCAVAHSDEVDFMSLKNAVKTTDGNLSIQLKKLEEAGFLNIHKIKQSGRLQTNMALTNKGFMALKAYKELLMTWLDV